jgi:hypothetical protein
MPELRITGVSNNQLELQAPDGTRHYLEISEDLLRALRQREVSLPPTLSAREIQQQIRLGASVDEVVSATGADRDLVDKFAKPIIAELNHIVAIARSIRLSLAGDRFADPMPVEFGKVMDERLAINGSFDSKWSARKNLDGEWLVSIDFQTPNGAGVATWSFDPKKLFLAPENEAALQLSNGVPVSAISKTVPLQTEQTKENVVQEHPANFLTVVPQVAEEEAPEQVNLFEEETVSTANLRIVPELAEEITTTEISIIEIVEVSQDEPLIQESENETTSNYDEVVTSGDASAEDQNVSGETTAESKPQVNSRWAEVLFGSKDDEEDN